MKKQKKVKTYVEIFQGERKSWGNVNPVTRVIPDKRFKKPKYKGLGIMRKIEIKRIVYRATDGTEYIGSQEYDGHLTDENILGAIHTIGKTVWRGHNLWQLEPELMLTVEKFYQYEKSTLDLLIDRIRRII